MEEHMKFMNDLKNQENIKTLTVEGATLDVVRLEIRDGYFYILYKDCDYCLYIVDDQPENMDRKTIEAFMEKNINMGVGYCGTLEEMEEQLKICLSSREK